MEAELKEAFERIEQKIDTNNANVNQRFDSIDKRMNDFEELVSTDHDKLIGIEKDIEYQKKEMQDEKETQARYGRGLASRIEKQEKKTDGLTTRMWIMTIAIIGGNQGIEYLKAMIGG